MGSRELAPGGSLLGKRKLLDMEQALCEMGFDEDQAATALANADGDLASAIALLCI